MEANSSSWPLGFDDVPVNLNSKYTAVSRSSYPRSISDIAATNASRALANSKFENPLGISPQQPKFRLQTAIAKRCLLVQFTLGDQMARPKGKKVATRLSVGLSKPQHAALTALAEQNEATVAWLVRRAVAEFLERHKKVTTSPLSHPMSRKANRFA
jgi:hypothetical protein